MRLRGFVFMLVVAGALVVPGVAHAWKPFMHVYAAARADAMDGTVTINGREYTVRPEVATALRNWESYYNAGAVGPDGFPDLTMGQSVVHPENTGEWVRHILTKAWDAQSDPSYSPAQREQILAFSYGFATHAAGDMWAHTLVNDFALGVFPGVSEILTEIDKAEIALRHIIVEGYMGDATPGFDGNPDRTVLADGDVSDDATAGIAYDAPIRFVYETLIDPNAPTPTPDRGPLLDFFLELQADLQVQERRFEFDGDRTDCAIIDPDCYEVPHTLTVNTVLGPRQTTVVTQDCIGATIGCLASPVDAADDLIINSIGEAYLEAWIDDIDTGVRRWGELGLAITKALFDPQATRNTQNDECDHLGSEFDLPRINCEDAIGAVDVVLHEADDFIDDHLLSMLGLPDAAGDIHDLLQLMGDTLDDILGPALNPLRLVTAEITELAKTKVKELIRDRYGIDVDAVKEFVTHPTHWLNVTSATITLPLLGPVTIDLFQPGSHARLDEILGLAAAHHVPSDFPFPGASTRLADSSVFDPATFAPLRNTVAMSKLTLLDGGELNRLAGDELVDQGIVNAASVVKTYREPNELNGHPANVMVHPLRASVGANPSSWLLSIDDDHAWRADGLPRFDRPAGGNGRFPFWESCVLRPAFRSIFTDWENGALNFPDLGDAVSPDPATDPTAPETTLTTGGNVFASGGTTYLGGSHSLTLAASDAVFTPASLSVVRRFYADGAAAGPLVPIANGGSFSLAGADGLYHVDYRATDACAAEPLESESFVLDSTGPEIAVTSPAPEGIVFDTDDLSSIGYTVTDAGSGVASDSVTFDGAAAANGDPLDMYLLDPGVHTIVVTSADNLGNESEETRTFEVQATAESLVANVERACAEGLVTKAGICAALLDKLGDALAAHDAGDHATEHEILGAFVNHLEAQRGKSVDPATANRFIAYAQDLIARGG